MPIGDSLRKHRRPKDMSPAVAVSNMGWTIRQMAEEFGLSLRTFRFYESKGLVKPDRSRTVRGANRFHSEDDRIRVRAILRAIRFGLPLNEIREFIDRSGGRNAKPDSDLPADAARRQAEHLKEQHEKLGEALAEVEHYLE